MRRYLTEEELALLIRQTEEAEPYAPAGLKEELLQKIGREEAHRRKRLHASGPESIFLYSAKVVAGMAASILLVFTLPEDVGIVLRQVYQEKMWKEMEEYRSMTPEERLSEMEKNYLEKLWEQWNRKQNEKERIDNESEEEK